MLTDEKFCERAMKFYLLKGVDGTYYTLDSYREKIKALQTDKDKTVCYLYASDAEEEHAYIEKAKAKGYDVLLMDSPLESHFINLLEQKLEKSRFVRVDSNTVEKLIPHDEAIPEKLSKEEKEKLQPIIEGEVDKQKFTVQLESLEESDAPMQVTQSEFMRRYREMAQTSGGGMGSLSTSTTRSSAAYSMRPTPRSKKSSSTSSPTWPCWPTACSKAKPSANSSSARWR